MRGEIISKEYQGMVFVHDRNGKEYACYAGMSRISKEVKTSLRMKEKNVPT